MAIVLLYVICNGQCLQTETTFCCIRWLMQYVLQWQPHIRSKYFGLHQVFLVMPCFRFYFRVCRWNEWRETHSNNTTLQVMRPPSFHTPTYSRYIESVFVHEFLASIYELKIGWCQIVLRVQFIPILTTACTSKFGRCSSDPLHLFVNASDYMINRSPAIFIYYYLY